MHPVETIRELVAYDTWANRRLLGAIREAGSIDRVNALFGHLLAAHDIWWARIRNESPPDDAWNEADPAGFAERIERAHDRLIRLLDEEDEQSLDRPVTYRNLRGEGHATPLREILVHLAHHGTHHRGQIVATLVEHGHRTPWIDFIVFVRERRGDHP